MGGNGLTGRLPTPGWVTATPSQEPRLTAVQPLFGPRAGGTRLTLEGQGLAVGNNRTVLVNGTECRLQG